MPNKGDIYLGVLGGEILLPTGGRVYSIEPEEIGRLDRTASGRLVTDFVAEKKKFLLDHSLMDGDDLADIIALYDLHQELSLLIYHTDQTDLTTTPSEGQYYDSYTVIMRPISRKRLLIAGVGLWENVPIELWEV
jgi:hypothetical protein